MKLFPEFQNFVKTNALLQEGTTLVVGVSGGPDSMVLLHLLARSSKKLGIRPVVAHVNYGLRGKDSDQDEKLVRLAAEKLGLEICVLKKKPALGENLQDSARRIRQNFFFEKAKSLGAKAIVLAHHADDQCETILLHMIRGAGLAGLSGMRPSMPIDGFCLLRPLLFAKRADILEYAREQRIDYREDRTNKKDKYSRNALRLNVMPLLAKLNPCVVDAICELALAAQDANDFLSTIVDSVIGEATFVRTKDEIKVHREFISELPAAVRRAMVIELFRRMNGTSKDLNSDQINKMMDLSSEKCCKKASYRLPAKWKFEKDGDFVSLSRQPTNCDRR